MFHGTCVAFKIGRKNVAVLIRGKPGSGKSDLALRLLSMVGHKARLISDDQVILRKKSGKIWAVSPETIRGLLEVRGVGICKIREVLLSAPLALVIDLVPLKKVPRFPDAEFEYFEGVKLPRRNLYAFEASAPLKLYKMLVE